MQPEKSPRRADRIILLIALAGCLASFPFIFESVYLSVFPQAVSSEGVSFGKISETDSDVRLKRQGRLSWDRARNDGQIFLGDSIFVGTGSSSQILPKEGGKIILGSNTLVTFKKINGLELPDFSAGNIQLAVNGSMQIAVAGEVYEIQGQNSEVQLFFDQNAKPVFKTTKGAAEARKQTPAQETLVTAAPEPLPQATPEPEPFAPQNLVFENESYILKLRDLYTLLPRNRLRVKEAPQIKIPSKQIVDLSLLDSTETLQLTVKNDANSEATSQLVQGGKTWPIQEAWVGTNFVHLQNSSGQTYASGRFLGLAETAPIQLRIKRVKYDQEAQMLSLDISADRAIKGFVVEFSDDAIFDPEDEKRFLLPKEIKKIPFKPRGLVWIRAQAVLEEQKLTDFSDAVRQFTEPLRPSLGAPSLRLATAKATTFQTFEVAWEPVAGAREYLVEWTDTNGERIQHTTTGTTWNLKPTREGSAQVRVKALGDGQESDFSKSETVEVASSLPFIEKPRPSLAQEMSTSTTPRLRPEPVRVSRNGVYDSNSLAIEPGGFVALSSAQNNAGQQEVMATALTLRGNYWQQTLGLDALIRSQVVGITEQAQQSSPYAIDLRALYRPDWRFLKLRGRDPFFALGVGAEMYRNTAARFYSRQHDLLKAGFRMNFRVFDNWSTGGDAYFGFGADNSSKFEISGNFAYYLKKDLSFGAGYRLSQFEAGSLATTPNRLPYREVYGEGFSVLRFHY